MVTVTTISRLVPPKENGTEKRLMLEYAGLEKV